MKNQRRNKPKDQLKGQWDYQYKSPQKAHHTKDINTAKPAHQKKKSIKRGK